MKVGDPSYFGAITFGEPETAEYVFPGDTKRKISLILKRAEWHPPNHLAERMLDGFTVPLDFYYASCGRRHVVLHANFEEVIDLGAVGGLAVLEFEHDFDKATVDKYCAKRLIQQYVRGRRLEGYRGMQEHLARNFGSSRDLFVRSSGRLSDDARDVLPDDLGLNGEGEGHRLGPAQLMDLGRRSAYAAGQENPISEVAIDFGLYEAAKMNPLDIEPAEVPGLVKGALFDIDPSDGTPSEELLDIVEERLVDAIKRHLCDTREEFSAWFLGPNSSVIKQIAQQKRRRGGRLSHKDVRRAVLHLGWGAYGYVGQCIDALVRTIKNSILPPLNEEERRFFEHKYESQPYYGNLPLVLLAERAPFLRRVVPMIWSEPADRRHIQVLHRLLAYYAEMAPKRREVDRRSKNRCSGSLPTLREETSSSRRKTAEDAAAGAKTQIREEDETASRNSYSRSIRFVPNLHDARLTDEKAFSEVAAHIRELRKIECDKTCGRWYYSCDGLSGNWLTIRIACECGVVNRVTVHRLDRFLLEN